MAFCKTESEITSSFTEFLKKLAKVPFPKI